MIEIREERGYDPWEVTELYESVGWTNYTANPELLMAAFGGSLLILGAFDGERLVGLVRCVGDGVSIVYIQDLLVLPNYQRGGIGKALVRAVVERYPSVRQMVLMTDDIPETVGFYKACGFEDSAHFRCRSLMRIN